MKYNKAADESGVMSEYTKALEVEGVEKLRGLMNGILNGADIPKAWKDSRVKLLHTTVRCGGIVYPLVSWIRLSKRGRLGLTNRQRDNTINIILYDPLPPPSSVI